MIHANQHELQSLFSAAVSVFPARSLTDGICMYCIANEDCRPGSKWSAGSVAWKGRKKSQIKDSHS